MKKLFRFKYVFIGVISLLGVASLSSCDNLNNLAIKANETYIYLARNESKTVQISYDFQNIGYEIEIPSLVSIYINGNEVTFRANNFNGVSNVRLYNLDNQDVYLDFLIVIGEDDSYDNSYKIGFKENYRKTYYINEIPTFSDLNPYLYQENSTSQIILNRSDYYFSISTLDPLTEEGNLTVYIAAPEYTNNIASFEINVVFDEYEAIINAFNNLKSNDNYSMSFKGDAGYLLELNGMIYKNDNYYVNTYRDSFVVNENNNFYIASFERDTEGNVIGINANNGYLSNLVDGLSLDNAINKVYGLHTLKEFDISYLSKEDVENGRFIYLNQDNLNFWWNDVLGFNGRGTSLLLSYQEDSILYTLNGQLNNGLEITFNGSIFEFNKSSHSYIDQYLNTSHSVNVTVDEELNNIYQALSNFNYTYVIGETVYKFTDKYIEYTSETGVNGYIELDDGVYNFRVNNGEVEILDLVSGINNVENFSFNLANYPLFKENLGTFIQSSYYGGYVSFNSLLNEPIINDYFSSRSSSNPFGIGINYENNQISIYCYYMSNDNLAGTYMVLTDVGSTYSTVVESYLANL